MATRELRWRASERVRLAARRLRRAETAAERALWAALRRRRLDGLRFHRQHPCGSFILDFYCPARRLAVEVDGGVHDSDDQSRYDAERATALLSIGVEVVRVTNREVMTDLGAVLRRITVSARHFASSNEQHCAETNTVDLLPPRPSIRTPSPAPAGEGRPREARPGGGLASRSPQAYRPACRSTPLRPSGHPDAATTPGRTSRLPVRRARRAQRR